MKCVVELEEDVQGLSSAAIESLHATIPNLFNFMVNITAGTGDDVLDISQLVDGKSSEKSTINL